MDGYTRKCPTFETAQQILNCSGRASAMRESIEQHFLCSKNTLCLFSDRDNFQNEYCRLPSRRAAVPASEEQYRSSCLFHIFEAIKDRSILHIGETYFRVLMNYETGRYRQEVLFGRATNVQLQLLPLFEYVASTSYYTHAVDCLEAVRQQMVKTGNLTEAIVARYLKEQLFEIHVLSDEELTDIVISLLDGKTHVVGFGYKWTTSDLKKRVERLTGMKRENFDLQYENERLADERQVSDYGIISGEVIDVVLGEEVIARRVRREAQEELRTVGQYSLRANLHAILHDDNVALLDLYNKAGRFYRYSLAVNDRLLRAPKVFEYIASQPWGREYMFDNAQKGMFCSVRAGSLSFFKRFLSYIGGRCIPSTVFVLRNLNSVAPLRDFIKYYITCLHCRDAAHVLCVAMQHLYNKPELNAVVMEAIGVTPNFPPAAFITAVNLSCWSWADEIIRCCTKPSIVPVDLSKHRNFTERGMKYLDSLLEHVAVKTHGAAKLAGTLLQQELASETLLRKLLWDGVPERVGWKISTYEQLMIVLQCAKPDEKQRVVSTAIERLVKAYKHLDAELVLEEEDIQEYLTEDVLFALAKHLCRVGSADFLEQVLLRHLVLHGNPLRSKDKRKDPLCIAVANSRLGCVKLLLERADYTEWVYCGGEMLRDIIGYFTSKTVVNAIEAHVSSSSPSRLS